MREFKPSAAPGRGIRPWYGAWGQNEPFYHYF